MALGSAFREVSMCLSGMSQGEVVSETQDPKYHGRASQASYPKSQGPPHRILKPEAKRRRTRRRQPPEPKAEEGSSVGPEVLNIYSLTPPTYYIGFRA